MSLDPRHYDVIVSPVITEKATTASEHNKVVFKVALSATKPQIKEAVEKLFDVKVEERQHAGPQGEDEVLQGPQGRAERREEGGRDPRRGSLHRHHDGSVSRDKGPETWRSKPSSR